MKVYRAVIDRTTTDHALLYGRDEFTTVREVVYTRKIQGDELEVTRFTIFKGRVKGEPRTIETLPIVGMKSWENRVKHILKDSQSDDSISLTADTELSKHIEMTEEQWADLSVKPYFYKA